MGPGPDAIELLHELTSMKRWRDRREKFPGLYGEPAVVQCRACKMLAANEPEAQLWHFWRFHRNQNLKRPFYQRFEKLRRKNFPAPLDSWAGTDMKQELKDAARLATRQRGY